jgi:hypothetical protein
LAGVSEVRPLTPGLRGSEPFALDLWVIRAVTRPGVVET